jgi:tetratricopeptide (TPR) repeat protein
MANLSFDALYAPARIIGRDIQIAAIDAALQQMPFDGQVLYFCGDGGAGKTRLLHEAQIRAQSRQATIVCDLIDFYHVRYSQPITFMRSIMQSIRRALPRSQRQSVFQQFEKKVKQFYQRREDDSIWNYRQQQEIEQLFVRDYRAIVQQYAVVIVLDSLETLIPVFAHSVITTVYQPYRVEHWLVGLLKQLPNMLVVCAGRSRPNQYQLLNQLFQKNLNTIVVPPMNALEVHEFFLESIDQLKLEDYNINELFIHRLCQISKGQAIILAIIISLVNADVFDLNELLSMSFNQRTELDSNEWLMSTLLTTLQERHPGLGVMLSRAVYWRKGISKDLLQYFERDTQNNNDHAHLFEQFKKLIFVKPTGDEAILLHDQVYEYFFDKVSVAESPYLYNKAIEYLKMQANITMHGTNLAHSRFHQSPRIDQLYYELAVSPTAGYRRYRELRRGAIIAHDEALDIQLREEFARFVDDSTRIGSVRRAELAASQLSWDLIEFHECLHAIHRRLNTHTNEENRYQQAITMADQTRSSFEGLLDPADLFRKLDRIELEVLRLEARIYLPNSENNNLPLSVEYHSVIQELEKLRNALEIVPIESDDVEIRYQHIISLLARANNNLGYHERKQQELPQAIERYQISKQLYQKLGVDAQRSLATTMNNLGFALAQQGDLVQGLTEVEAAYILSKQHKSQHRIATGLNTQARIQMFQGKLKEALKRTQQAINIYQMRDSVRGLAQSFYAQGEIRRRIAFHMQRSLDSQLRECDEAIACYRQAIVLFDRDGDWLNRIEARQGLGCAYRNRVAIQLRYDIHATNDIKRAAYYLQRALELIPQNSSLPITAGIWEDLALLHYHLKQLDECRYCLSQALSIIPSQYDILSNVVDQTTTKSYQQRIFWLRRSHVEVLLFACDFDIEHPQQSCNHLVRAFACAKIFLPSYRHLGLVRSLSKRTLSEIRDTRQLRKLQQTLSGIASELQVDELIRGEIQYLFKSVRSRRKRQ